MPTPTRPPSWPEVIKFYPDVPSKVVHARHAGVWAGDTLSPVVLHQMLDASITELTGLNDAHEAWAALFDPHERIAIKVNTIEESRYWTHVPLVMAVAEKLQEIGVPAEQIFIFDRATFEMEGAGYPINEDGPGVRCYGSGKKGYTENWTLKGYMEDGLRDSPIGLSNILLDCDALINIPLLKSHHISGISFAMKNHFGTFDRPGYYFHQRIGGAIPELNVLSPIRERSRLIIGDTLEIVNNTRWITATTGDSILMSFDPVAHDTVGLNLHNKVSTGASRATSLSKSWLKYGAELGLGTNDLTSIELVEVTVG